MAVFGAQYSIGEQGDAKKEFYLSGMSKCQKCGQRTTRTSVSAGCRMNGDAYGTDEFHCSCGWKTSFQWDEASDTHYYETECWKQERERLRTSQTSAMSDQEVKKDSKGNLVGEAWTVSTTDDTNEVLKKPPPNIGREPQQNEDRTSGLTGGQEKEEANKESNPPAAAEATKTAGAAKKPPVLTRGNTWQAGGTTRSGSGGAVQQRRGNVQKSKEESEKSDPRSRAAAARSSADSGPTRAITTGTVSAAAPRRTQSQVTLSEGRRDGGMASGREGGTSAIPGYLRHTISSSRNLKLPGPGPGPASVVKSSTKPAARAEERKTTSSSSETTALPPSSAGGAQPALPSASPPPHSPRGGGGEGTSGVPCEGVRGTGDRNLKIRLEWSDGYGTSREGFKPLPYPPSLDLSVLEGFQNGVVSEEQVAHALISALFKRDFGKSVSPGKHWSHDGSDVRDVTPQEPEEEWDEDYGEEGRPYKELKCECSSTWDWKDIYAVVDPLAPTPSLCPARGPCRCKAASRCTMLFFTGIISPKSKTARRLLVRLRDYKHNCAG